VCGITPAVQIIKIENKQSRNQVIVMQHSRHEKNPSENNKEMQMTKLGK